MRAVRSGKLWFPVGDLEMGIMRESGIFYLARQLNDRPLYPTINGPSPTERAGSPVSHDQWRAPGPHWLCSIFILL